MGDIHLDINGNFSVLPYHVLLFNSTTTIYTEIMLHLLIIVPGRIATKKERKLLIILEQEQMVAYGKTNTETSIHCRYKNNFL